VLDDDPPGRFVELCHEAVHEIIGLRTSHHRRKAEHYDERSTDEEAVFS
jgi:hypothetical protein